MGVSLRETEFCSCYDLSLGYLTSHAECWVSRNVCKSRVSVNEHTDHRSPFILPTVPGPHSHS